MTHSTPPDGRRGPTGLTEVHPSLSREPIVREAKDLATVCVLCSHNCGIRVDVAGGRIVAVRPDETNPITGGYVCNKAATVAHYVEHDQRVRHPMRKGSDGRFEEVSWETAISEIAEKLGALREKHGGRSLGLVGVGGQANHLDAPYATSFLKAFGSRRWFNAYAQEKTQHHLVDSWMFDASPAAFMHADQHRTAFMLLMGTNPRISNRGPKATDTFKELAKKRSCAVIAIDPRQTETTKQADRHLRVRPGTDAFLLLGMAASIVQNELFDAAFLEASTVGFNEVRDVLCRVDVGEMGRRCGLDPALLGELAEGFAGSGASSIMYDLGVEQTRFSTLVSYLIRLNLCLTGNMGREGGNLFIETFSPGTLSPGRHKEPERAIVSGIPAIRALGNIGMFSPTLVPEEIMVDHPDRIRALIVEGSNPLLSFSDSARWREAVGELELMVVIDPAFTETARLADYVLPTPTGYEKWEIALFPKRHPQIDVQLRPPVVAGPARALPEAEIYICLAEAMGLLDEAPEELAELALENSPEARTAFLGAAMQLAAESSTRGIDAEAQVLAWAYRTIGRHFKAPALVAVWFLCQENAMQRRSAVLATLGAQWADKSPLELGEEIFRRVMEHPEGVEVACIDSTDNLADHLGYEDKKIRLAPKAMLGEMERAMDSPAASDPDYPFILSNGLRTRWTANTIQRDPRWRKGRGPHCKLHISPGDAESLSVSSGDVVRLKTRRGSVELPAEVDAKLMDGHMSIPNGFGMQYDLDNGDEAGGEARDLGNSGAVWIDGVNMNELSDASDRDPFTGCPHHRYQPCRVERLEAVS
ncbi:MAG: molybdopterin-dependent oxidoreductase [Candidatus Binatia bacterium]